MFFYLSLGYYVRGAKNRIRIIAIIRMRERMLSILRRINELIQSNYTHGRRRSSKKRRIMGVMAMK